MYKIIGGDQKVYGPITADQLREWHREGRANAETHILPDGATEWVPFATLPEFADLFAARPAASLGPYGVPVIAASPETILSRDYTIDIGNCISRAWTLVKANFGPVVGISFLIYLVALVVNQIPGIFTRPLVTDMIQNHHFSPQGILILFVVSWLFAPVYTVLMGGLFKYYIKLIRGEPASVGDAFSGFGCFVQLVLLGWVMNLLVWIGMLFCVIPGYYLAVAWYFALPLVIDRKMNFWEAMELSRKVVNKHWFLVFALTLVAGLLAISGVIACCIGIFVTMPLGFVALMYAYEDIFGPPPP